MKRSKKPATGEGELPPKKERLELIASMMAANTWKRGKSGYELAERYGCNPNTIERDAAEASRLVRGALSDEELRQQLEDMLHRTAALAEEDGEYHAVVSAAKLLFESRGLLIKKIEQRNLPPESEVDDVLRKHGIVLPDDTKAVQHG